MNSASWWHSGFFYFSFRLNPAVIGISVWIYWWILVQWISVPLWLREKTRAYEGTVPVWSWFLVVWGHVMRVIWRVLWNLFGYWWGKTTWGSFFLEFVRYSRFKCMLIQPKWISFVIENWRTWDLANPIQVFLLLRKWTPTLTLIFNIFEVLLADLFNKSCVFDSF